MTRSPLGPIGVAVVGYSFMGKAHSHAWRSVGAFFPHTRAVRRSVLVGRDPAQLDTAAAAYGWEDTATDWRSVMERDDVDVVDICTPGHLHAEIAEAALLAGKHVLCEKPLANDLETAVAMAGCAAEARGRGVRSMVGFNYRRVPALALARRLLNDGHVGAVRQVRIAYLQDWLTDAQAPMTWRLRKESAGSGALGDLASHAVDQLRYLTGDEVVSVSATTRTFVPERVGEHGVEPVTVDDAVWATLETDGGVVCSLEVSRVAAGRKNGLTIEVYGERGSISFDLERLNELRVHDVGSRLGGTETLLVTEADHPYLDAWWPPGHVLGWEHTFTHQAADLLLAIEHGEDPAPSFDDGLRVQHVLAAIEQSASSGTRVQVPAPVAPVASATTAAV